MLNVLSAGKQICLFSPPLEPIKPAVAYDYKGGKGAGRPAFPPFNIFIEKAARIINYIPIVPFNARLIAARSLNNIPNSSKYKSGGLTFI